MSRAIRNEYMPDHVTAPGETLLETLDALGMSQADLSDRTGRSKKLINEIIKGKAPITPKMAIQLERVVGVPASFWNNRESNYREFIARLEETERLNREVAWLSELPIKSMVRLGWIKQQKDKVYQLQEVLNFLGIASPAQWESLESSLVGSAKFRQSKAYKADPKAILCWLRRGEVAAKHVSCNDYSSEKFKEVLKEIRLLTNEPPKKFQFKLKQLCAHAGVAVVFIHELPKIRLSGATRWISSNKAVIQLSLRYRTNDHLWFSFFHEAGHILKHGKREIFIDGQGTHMDEKKEREANTFASDFLIPRKRYYKFIENDRFTKSMILRFASELKVAPGIVVGRLQHDKLLPMSHCNDLKERFEWVSN